MNRFLKQLDLNNIWLSPSGIIVEQRYVKMDTSVINSSVLGKKRKINIRKPIIEKSEGRKASALRVIISASFNIRSGPDQRE